MELFTFLEGILQLAVIPRLPQIRHIKWTMIWRKTAKIIWHIKSDGIKNIQLKVSLAVLEKNHLIFYGPNFFIKIQEFELSSAIIIDCTYINSSPRNDQQFNILLLVGNTEDWLSLNTVQDRIINNGTPQPKRPNFQLFTPDHPSNL